MAHDELRQFIDDIGIDVFCRRLGIPYQTIASIRARGHFPATWWLAMDQLCEELGMNCPTKFFAFRPPFEVLDGSLPEIPAYSKENRETTKYSGFSHD